jgi:hypothetical protein
VTSATHRVGSTVRAADPSNFVLVQPSSLVFLVIIAIWAAYLLQHWVRRREHLATARSVDRFSDAMRVLERRTSLPEFDLSAPRPRSYAVSPARPSRPEVVVKRAQSLPPNIPTRPEVAVRPTRFFHVLAGVSARRGRGLSLLASLLLMVVVSPLAVISVLHWWSVLVAVAVLVADVAWLHHVAVSERAIRQAKALARGSAASPARSASRSFAEREPVAATSGVGAAEVAEPNESPAGVDPSGWAPVPVPPPTYTLKAKAARPAPEPEPEPVAAAVTEPAPVQSSSLDGLVDEGELDGLLDRRRTAAT